VRLLSDRCAWRLSLNHPKPQQRRSNVNPAVRRIGSPGKRRVHPCERKRKGDETPDAEHRHHRRRRRGEATSRMRSNPRSQKHGGHEDGDVDSHASNDALTKSRVPEARSAQGTQTSSNRNGYRDSSRLRHIGTPCCTETGRSATRNLEAVGSRDDQQNGQSAQMMHCAPAE
jgi:hypothetical protein